MSSSPPPPGKALTAEEVLKWVNPGMSTQNGPNNGALVMKLEKFGSAPKAGLQVGDEIMTWNNKAPKTGEELLLILGSVGIGGTLKLSVLRGGNRIELNMPIVAKRKTLSLDLDEVDAVLERKISP
jgi:S1-C subfamily serine protease